MPHLASLLSLIALALSLSATGSRTARSHGAQPSSPSDYFWSLAVPEGRADWPRWNQPVLGPDGKLWAFQQARETWSTSDGARWSRHPSNAGWGERYLSGVAHFRGKFWLFGGRSGPGVDARYENDIWVSANGTDWQLARAHAEWSPRAGHTVLLHNGQLWLIGGGNGTPLADAWRSSDGLHWSRVTRHIGWSPLWHREILAWNGRLWVIGFHTSDDVWSSPDGVNWSPAARSTGWGSDAFKHAIAFDGFLWAMGGADNTGNFRNDVWRSRDARVWERITPHAPWSPRATNYSAVFRGKLWIFGGKNARDDVWVLEVGRKQSAVGN